MRCSKTHTCQNYCLNNPPFERGKKVPDPAPIPAMWLQMLSNVEPKNQLLWEYQVKAER